MNKRNFEPLLILGFTGMFLLFMAGSVMHVFQEKPQLAAVSIVFPEIPADDTVKAIVKPAPLQTVLVNGDTIPGLFIGMDSFYQSVQQVQTLDTLVHIAYFGDSMIEGDLVTQSLRHYLQLQFGGRGIGFISVTSPFPGIRNTIKQSFNDSWSVSSFVNPANSEGVYPGISGYVFISAEGAESKYELPAGFGRFHSAKILYGGKNCISVNVKTDTLSSLLSLLPENPISSVTIQRDSAFSVFEIKVSSTEPGVFYGVNFENGPGVYVDNYAFRGISGLPLAAIPSEIFSGLNATLSNKLIILHYGLNVFAPGVVDYHWYEATMLKVIRHIKQSSPGISILLISMPDRSVLISGEYQTPAELPEFIHLQQKIAEKGQIAFFNLYEAMGGANSMKRWVEGPSKMANDDYTHPNVAGAAQIASFIYDFLMKGYERYVQKTDSISFEKSQSPRYENLSN